ncbi:hypothetical protein [uncultured Eudoraea sp.]|uniref:hypothetical protein n=1 Tax=uncultured Eudoraea sp. TaxID=1035614 RepID=UPI002618B94C|nr:hypothetical protein [uncultured Eudoraea sp.]
MKLLQLFIVFVIYSFCFPNNTYAQQDSTALWHVVTLDGNEYNGTLISRDADEIVLNSTNLGEITIPVATIKKLTRLEDRNIVQGEVWTDNPQATRYFWAPSSYGLKKGESYYQNVWIFFNQFAFGVTENFSIGLGIVPIFLFGGYATPVWVTPKFSIPIEENKFNLGVGGLFGSVLGNGGGYGIVYGTTTFGSRDKNVNIGVGYGFIDDEWADVPTLSLSAVIRTGKRGYFLTENYIIDAGDSVLGILSFGGRTVLNGGVSIDYGGFIPLEEDIDGFILVPWLGIVVPLGKKGKISEE